MMMSLQLRFWNFKMISSGTHSMTFVPKTQLKLHHVLCLYSSCWNLFIQSWFWNLNTGDISFPYWEACEMVSNHTWAHPKCHEITFASRIGQWLRSWEQIPMKLLRDKIKPRKRIWLVVSTHFKNISQNGNLPQIGVKIKYIWNHHLGIFCCFTGIFKSTWKL